MESGDMSCDAPDNASAGSDAGEGVIEPGISNIDTGANATPATVPDPIITIAHVQTPVSPPAQQSSILGKKRPREEEHPGTHPPAPQRLPPSERTMTQTKITSLTGPLQLARQATGAAALAELYPSGGGRGQALRMHTPPRPTPVAPTPHVDDDAGSECSLPAEEEGTTADFAVPAARWERPEEGVVPMQEEVSEAHAAPAREPLAEDARVHAPADDGAEPADLGLDGSDSDGDDGDAPPVGERRVDVVENAHLAGQPLSSGGHGAGPWLPAERIPGNLDPEDHPIGVQLPSGMWVHETQEQQDAHIALQRERGLEQRDAAVRIVDEEEAQVRAYRAAVATANARMRDNERAVAQGMPEPHTVEDCAYPQSPDIDGRPGVPPRVPTELVKNVSRVVVKPRTEEQRDQILERDTNNLLHVGVSLPAWEALKRSLGAPPHDHIHCPLCAMGGAQSDSPFAQTLETIFHEKLGSLGLAMACHQTSKFYRANVAKLQMTKVGNSLPSAEGITQAAFDNWYSHNIDPKDKSRVRHPVEAELIRQAFMGVNNSGPPDFNPFDVFVHYVEYVKDAETMLMVWLTKASMVEAFLFETSIAFVSHNSSEVRLKDKGLAGWQKQLDQLQKICKMDPNKMILNNRGVDVPTITKPRPRYVMEEAGTDTKNAERRRMLLSDQNE